MYPASSSRYSRIPTCCLLPAFRSLNAAGMDLSGLSDPYCVASWNGNEVGRTMVCHETRDPDWVGDDSDGELTRNTRTVSVAAGFELPFFVPETEKWGEQEWPPMCLEVRSVYVRMERKDPRDHRPIYIYVGYRDVSFKSTHDAFYICV